MTYESNAQEFIEKYKLLEVTIRKKYKSLDNSNDSPVYFLMHRPEFSDLFNELDYCRKLRNLISHNPGAKDNVQPSKELIDLLDNTIYKVKNPPLAKQRAVPKAKVLCAGMDDKILPIMREMNKRIYTHVPILENGKVIGIFSENTIFSYLADEEIVEIDKNATFRDIEKYLPISAHRAESFRFVGRRTLLREVMNMFDEAVKKGDRIGLIIITETGNPEEKLLGIMTAWDVAGL